MHPKPLLLAVLLLSACRDPEPAKSAAPPPKPPPIHAETVPFPPGVDPLAPIVLSELERARTDGRDLVVYVGATWCEPCQRFHDAVTSGELDSTFPTLRLLELDLDQDRERLKAAGYVSRMIPLFAIPGPDGRASGRAIQGSIKGEGAVANIVPRLEELLATARAASDSPP